MVKTNLPVILLRGVALLPHNELRIEIQTDLEKRVLSNAELYHDNHLLLVSLDDPLELNPSISDLPKTAVIGRVKSKIELPNGIMRIVIIGVDRAEVLNYLKNDLNNNYLEAFVIPTKHYDIDEKEATALTRILFRDLEMYIENAQQMSNSVMARISGVSNLSILSDIIAFELPIDYFQKLKYIKTCNPIIRMRLIIEDLNNELETVKLENKIDSELKRQLDISQKEFILKEKIKIIKEELGENDYKEAEIDKLRDLAANIDAPDAIKKRLNDEINKYELLNPAAPELNIMRNYIDWLLALPWNITTTDNDNLNKIKKSLDNTHYGLEKIKTRFIEYIAVKKNSNNLKSPIICLVGPPGTGKTTLAKSIASSLNKKFVKISVGGIQDEAEIVGHRRTYIGAAPGKIIQGMKKAKSNNPVFLIDEIDKMTKDYRGDPASALLDVLDKEQNKIFCDNYLEEEYDLSNVMFILTANTTSTIPEALKDRLEIIELSGYTEFEKLDIVKKHIIPKALTEHNIDKNNFMIDDETILNIIRGYTKEAGVRELERLLDTICRKIVTEIVSHNHHNEKYIINNKKVYEYLGKKKYYYSINNKFTKSGIINGLAYTIYGGDILKVEATYFKGKGNLILTGSLGEIMKESVQIAFSYLKSNHKLFGIDYDLLVNNDIHIHFEEGAIPKDGPSAGITITSALISLFTNKIVDSNIGMTGEMTLRGKILPIGGLKEKVMAAYRTNIKKIILPKENINDLDDIPIDIKNNMEFILVNDYKEVYRIIKK